MTEHDSETEAGGGRGRVFGTLAAVVGCNAVGAVGALTTRTDTAWYVGLTKPFFQPPGWIFGPMWTLLYTLMGVALYRLIERRHDRGAKSALALFAAQLVLNGAWSPVFFGAHAIGVALFVIGALVLVLALTIRQVRAVDRLASWLLVPYLLWVGFATVLNASLLALN